MFEIAKTHFAQNLAYANRLVADLSEDQFVAQPVANCTLNHPAFVIGHLAWVCDVGATLLGLPAVVPPAWKDIFSMTAKPIPNRDAYSSNAELVKAFEDAHTRLTKAVFEAKPELLNDQPPERFRSRFQSIGEVILHMLTNHEAVHLGQLSAWRRAMGLPSV